jgi:hypothetical protein
MQPLLDVPEDVLETLHAARQRRLIVDGYPADVCIGDLVVSV